MNRRDFVKSAGSLLAGVALAPPVGAAVTGAVSAANGRLTFPINRNWRYCGAATESARSRDFDDSRFDRLVVPHTNVRLPWHSFDEKDYEFISVYRRRFKLPAEARGRHVFVDFEGVMTATSLWLNGTRIGEYKGGYTPFSFDLTPRVDFEGENVLVVEVDSRERADIPPFGGNIDYLTFGGIYREVALRIVPSTFIENIFARPRDVPSAHPALDVDCFLQHLQPLVKSLNVEVELRDGDRVLAKAAQRVSPAAASSEAIAQTVHLDNLSGIELWDLAHRKLYSVHVRLQRGTQILDYDRHWEKFLIATPQDLPEDRPYSKERRLIEIVKAELAQGRLCHVFAVYTKTHDVTARISEVLSPAGIRTAVLKASVPTTQAKPGTPRRSPKVCR